MDQTKEKVVLDENEEIKEGCETPVDTFVSSLSLTTPSKKIIVKANFLDGYTLRQLFEFAKESLTCFPLHFYKNGIYAVRANGVETLVVRAHIRSVDLISYKVDEDCWNEPEYQRHSINVDIAGLHNQIRSVAKKEGIEIFQWNDEPGVVHFRPYGGNKNTCGTFQLRTDEYKPIEYTVDDGIPVDPKDNVVIPLTALCTAGINLTRVKYPSAILSVYPKGAYISGVSNTGSSSRINEWGELPKGFLDKEEPDDGCFYVKIDATLVKSLSKMANFQPGQTGIVRLCCRKNGIARMRIPLGCYGVVVCHIIDPDVE